MKYPHYLKGRCHHLYRYYIAITEHDGLDRGLFEHDYLLLTDVAHRIRRLLLIRPLSD